MLWGTSQSKRWHLICWASKICNKVINNYKKIRLFFFIFSPYAYPSCNLDVFISDHYKVKSSINLVSDWKNQTYLASSCVCMNIPLSETTMMEASTQRGSISKNGPTHSKTHTISNELTTDVKPVLLPACKSYICIYKLLIL